jgi:hypothetical protein
MQVLLLAPKVAQNYIAQFPETQRNAYKYFNYDNRVVEERVERFDQKPPYKYADDLTNEDYDALIKYAKTLINPILMKYSSRVASEDALHMAIRSFQNGLFDGKVNAGRYNVLLQAMHGQPMAHQVVMGPIQAKKKDDAPVKDIGDTVTLKPHEMKRLRVPIQKIPRHDTVRKVQKGVPHLVREEGKIKVKINK